MLCAAARDWLLMADDAGCPTSEVADHLAGCTACRALAAQITGLEATVRSSPTPAAAFASRDAFLTRLAPTPKRRSPIRQYVAMASAIAASLVLGITLAAITRAPKPGQPETIVAQAAPDVVEDLVEWNLRLTEAEAPAEREKLVLEQMPRLQAAVQRMNLSKDDRAFAEKLLANGKRMGETSDPIEEAEGFHEMADSLLVRLDAAADDEDRSEHLARMYAQVVDRGVEVNLARAEKQSLKAEKQVRVQNLTRAKHRQAIRAAEVAERIPEKAREHVKPNRPKAKGNRPAK
jgi:hypothetical protein